MEWRMLMPQPECRDCGVTVSLRGPTRRVALSTLFENSYVENTGNTVATPTPEAEREPRTRTGFIPYSIKNRLYSVDASLFSI
jgi:hypothetical protein